MGDSTTTDGHVRAETTVCASVPADRAHLLADMLGRLAALNVDELLAIDYLVAKLEAGRRKHGPLELDTDSRDWFEEAAQESADREHYKAFAAIQKKRRAG